jgi:hypothetical protein
MKTFQNTAANKAWCVLINHRLLAGESPALEGSGCQIAGNRCGRVTGDVEALYLPEEGKQ